MNQYQEIFDRLRQRAPLLARTNAAERIAKLRRLQQAVYDLRAEIGAAGTAELGQDGRAQMVPLKAKFDDVAVNLARWMERAEAAPNPALMGRRGYTQYEPKGVVLHLATWNAPMLISLSPVISMLAAGNAVLLKPSEIAPLAAEIVEKIIARADLGGDVAVVKGGPEVAQELLKLPFNHICYVGNNRIGRLVMTAAAQHFADVTLEMGGKNPIVVAADADLDDTAGKIVYGRHLVGGQACLCPDYILADAAIKDQLATRIVEKITAFYNPTGAGIQASRDLPRIINQRHTLRIKGLIDDAVAKGARVLTGGTVDVANRFVSPTLLEGITEEMDIFQEEIFGPVISIQAVASRDAAIAEIEKRPKPLGFYVFTRSREVADWYLDHTRAGSSAVNNIATQALSPSLAFGGVNHSGIGRLGGHAGFQEFSNPRGVVEDALEPSTGTPMMYPPYPVGMEAFLDTLLAPDPLPGA